MSRRKGRGTIRKRGRVDANQTAIVGALYQIGCSVLSLAAMGSGCPDLLVSRGERRTLLMEVKAKGGKLTEAQQEFHAWWNGELVVVHSVDEAIAVFNGN